MWVVVTLLITALIVLFEAPGLWKNRQWRELGVFSVLMAAGFILAILHSSNVRLPNPLNMIITIYKPLADSISRMLG